MERLVEKQIKNLKNVVDGMKDTDKIPFTKMSIESIVDSLTELNQYKDAEEQGLLHGTKVAIGQTVYTNFAMKGWYLRNKDKPYKAKVVFIGLNNSEEMGYGFFNVSYEKLGCMMQFRFSDIGKCVFLTKEEAEQVLKERKGDN